jgi:hypothetical protein
MNRVISKDENKNVVSKCNILTMSFMFSFTEERVDEGFT